MTLCKRLFYLGSDADAAIEESDGEILTIVSPGTAGDSTGYFSFVYRLLLQRPETKISDGTACQLV